MSRHLCRWAQKDMRRAALACDDLNIDVEHVIALDLLPEDAAFHDPLEDVLYVDGPEELEAIFGKPLGGQLYQAWEEHEGRDFLRDMGGFLVLGWFRPPDKEDVSLDTDGEVSGYGLACYQRPCRAWSPCLHTAIGKCLAQAARDTRNILREGREIALRKREA